MTFIDGVISTVTGVAASYAVWWYTFRVLTPKIRFSGSISKIPTIENPSGYKYRFKFENIGRRNMIDIEVVVRVRIKGLRKEVPGNWEVIYIPISSLAYHKLAIVRPVNRLGIRNVRPVFEIKAFDCDYFQKPVFDKTTQDLAADHKLTLDHVLGIGKMANLQILLFAYDEYSGARKFFESPEFSAQNITPGYFDLNGVNVIADASGNNESEEEDFT